MPGVIAKLVPPGTFPAEPVDMSTFTYRIVVGIDLSEYANVVLEHALDQAKRHEHAIVHAVTVAPQAQLDAARSRLARLAFEIGEAFAHGGRRVSVRLHARTGRPAEEIAALADETDAHLIVIGRFHKRRGAVAAALLELAMRPTLVVRIPEAAERVEPGCDACVRLRRLSGGERWFCGAHLAKDGHLGVASVMMPHVDWELEGRLLK
jgi:nucleotide-binding universal stress UspA family protein